MRKIMKLLPVFGFVVGATLVLTTSAFTEVSSNVEDPIWVLSDPMGQVSTVPGDYEQSPGTECPGNIHFCAFVAPETPTGEPDINAVPGLASDLAALHNNSESQQNLSNAVEFKDQQ